MQNALELPSVSSTKINGFIEGYSSGSSLNQKASETTTLDCVSPIALLYKLDDDGTRIEPALATSNIASDGSYSFDTKTSQLNIQGKIPTDPLIVQVNGCNSGVYFRPITGVSNQNVTMGSTVVGFLLNTLNKSKLASVLVNNPEQINLLLTQLSTAKSLSEAYEMFSSSQNIVSQFTNTFGLSPNVLTQASPEIVSSTIPKTSSELVASQFSVSASHFFTSYQMAYEWKLDNIVIGNTASFNFTPHANLQGSHTLKLTIGENNGAGGINYNQPSKELTSTLVITNNVLPTPPALRLTTPSVTGTTPVNTRNITLSINTGINKDNCSTFASLALTENTDALPSDSEFNISCTQSGSQNLNYSLTSSGDGLKILRLWAKDASGTKSTSSANLSVYLDTVSPTVTINSSPAAITNSNSSVFTFTSNDSGGTTDHYECQIDSSSFTNCTSPLIYSNLSEGSHSFRLKSFDTAGNTSPIETKTWIIDLTAPTLSLSNLPSAVTNQLISTISFLGTDDGGGTVSNYLCNLDNTGFSTCTSPYVNTLTAGSHNLVVKATDTAGNISSTQSYSWLIDILAPTVNISSQPNSLTNSTTAQFSFTGSDTGGGIVSSYECQIDNGGYSACTSPKSYTGLAATSHTFDVRAIDSANNTGIASRSNWTIDLTTPMASINSSPNTLTNLTSATYTFSATPPPGGSITGYECNLDNSSWLSCSSPKSYSGLNNGTHSFSIRSIDNNNNRSSTSSHNWTIDTTAPTLNIVASPQSISNLSTAQFSFNASDTGGGSVLQFNCKLDSGSYAICSSPVQYSSLTEGSHTLAITATDTSGNTSSPQTASWIIDLTAPTVSITSTPSIVTKSSSASFSFSATDSGGGNVASYKCSIDSQAYITCSNPKTYSSLNEGLHQFAVIALDSVGNISSASTYTWSIDQTAPTINISSTPTAVTNLTTANFSFLATDSGGGTVSSYSCKLDNGNYTTCSSPITYSNLSSGSHTFSMTATDSADNVSSPTSIAWSIDLTPPTVTITAPASNGSIALTSQLSSYPFSGTCSENDQVVSLGGAVSSTTSCIGGSWNTHVDLSGLSDGTISITASQTDAAGNNTTTTARTLIKDTVAPVITINTPNTLQGGVNTGAVSWSLTESNVGTGMSFSIEIYDGSTWSSIGTKAASAGSNLNQTYTLSNFSTPAVNTINAKIRATLIDAAGQSTTSNSGSFTIDSTPPVISSVTINNGATYAGSSVVNVQTTISDSLSGSNISIRMATATGAGECQSQYLNSGWIAWTSSTQNFAFTISPVDGTKKICVWAKDAVGNITTMSPTTGTAGVNYSTIIRQASSPPQMTAINVYNTSNNTNTYALNNPVTITWSASAAGGLDNNPIALSYSTNGTTWYDVVTKADSSIATNNTWLGGLSGTPTTASGSHTTFTAPSSSYFIIKAIARDVAGNMSVAVMSQPQNTGNWSIFAGNTDRGDNGSGTSSTLYSDGAGGRAVAINPLTNDIYAMDDGYGIRKLDIQTGMVTTYITHGTLSLPTNGTLSSSSRVYVSGASSMLIDSNGIMYYSSYYSNSASKIYKINLANNHVDFYIGGGTVNTTSATSSTIYASAGSIDLDSNNNLYFITDCNTTTPTYLTPKKLMMVSQNSDGTAGTFTEIAGGTCALGTPTAGQPAATQPLTAGTAYSSLLSIAAINPNFIYFSAYGNSPIKIVNGTIYSTNIGANSSNGILTYNRSSNRIYRSVSGLSFGYFTPNSSGNGGEVFTTAATSNGSGDCVSDGVDASAACVTVDSGFNFDSNGLVYFADGFKNNAPSGYRVRYIDSNNQIRTILGSLPFYGDGLNKGLIRGTVGGIYYKKSSESNQTTFPAGLYLVSPYVVFGRINESDQVYHTLWGNQQGNSYAAPTGTTISSLVSMGTPYSGGNGKAMTFDSNGLPWLRASNQLVQIDANNKVAIKANATSSWWELGGAPATSSMWVFGGYQNLTLKGSDGAFFIGGYQSAPAYVTNPQIRFLDFTNNLNTKVMGGSYTYNLSTPMSADITTPGNVQAAALYYNCTNSAACSIQYIESQDRLYFTNTGDRYIRYITHPASPTTSTLTTLPTAVPNSYIINFIFKEDLSQIFLLDSRGGLYCMDMNSGKSWCNNTTNLYPYATTMGSFTYGPNQMTWKDSSTLLISNYKGQILQYNLLP